MPRIIFVLENGSRLGVEAVEKRSVMLAAIDHDIPGIAAECGGACACATCHVYLDQADIGRVPPPLPMESDMLDGVAAELRPESRLSCQITVTADLDGVTVHVPDRQY